MKHFMCYSSRVSLLTINIYNAFTISTCTCLSLSLSSTHPFIVTKILSAVVYNKFYIRKAFLKSFFIFFYLLSNLFYTNAFLASILLYNVRTLLSLFCFSFFCCWSLFCFSFFCYHLNELSPWLT